ncbi:MAG: hypothetical protein KDK70_21195 [Myxococcales bacterium]|nr:hypothetical protein [Myxococcales bacterium]
MVLGNAMVATLLLSTPTDVPQAPGTDDGLDELLCELDAPTDGAVLEPALDPALDYAPAESPPAYPEPEPESKPKQTWRGGMYFSTGLAPMSTLHVEGFHPGVRYDVETGLAWKRGRARIYVGPDLHLLQYFGRKKPGFGVDAMMTLSLRHVYARVGAGTATGIPAYRDVHQTRPMMGGVVGGGLVGRLDEVEGRIGVDYDVRIDTTGRVAQTVLVTMRLTFGP